MPLSEAAKPAGRSKRRVSISWWPSGRVSWKRSVLAAPAWVESAPALRPRPKGRSPGVLAQGRPFGPAFTSKEEGVVSTGLSDPGVFDSGADQGVLVAVVVYLPQVAGLASAERSPPFRFRSRLVKGSWGRLLKLTFIWPSWASGSTRPGRLMKMPWRGASINR